MSYSIFAKGSTTFFTASLFFPKATLDEVTKVYAFVRTADDFVDNIPQDRNGFQHFKQQYYDAVKKGGSDNRIVNDYITISKKYAFEPMWIDRFLEAMEQDLTKKTYQTTEETLHYIYGSAEVIGLMMARIMKLPKGADIAAQMLGRAFQYINFIRDIAEDNNLGRTYIPATELAQFGFTTLSEKEAKAKPEKFAKLIEKQLGYYHQWQREGGAGFHFIPKRYRVAIATASDMYAHTAKKIAKDPLVVFQYKVKPSRLKIIGRALYHLAFS